MCTLLHLSSLPSVLIPTWIFQFSPPLGRMLLQVNKTAPSHQQTTKNQDKRNCTVSFLSQIYLQWMFSILNTIPNTGSIILVPIQTHSSYGSLDFYRDHQIYHVARANQGLGLLSEPKTSLSYSSTGKCAFSICTSN